MLPQFVSLGPLQANIYTALIGLAGVVSIALARALLRVPLRAALDTHLAFAIVALLGGRLAFVAANWDYFGGHSAAMVDLARMPGLNAQGALLAVLVLAWLARGRLNPLAVAPGLCIIGAAASIGCISNGCGYGREVFWTDGLAWALRVDWPDAYLIRNPRLPAQLLLAAWLLLWLAPVIIVARRAGHLADQLQAKTATLLALAACAAGDFGVAFARADAQPLFAQLRLEQWLDIAILCGSSLAAALHLRRRSGPG